MPAATKITVVIPNWNGMNWLRTSLDALKRQDLQEFHTIVVDNGSADGSVAFVRENYPHVEVVELGRNTGFAHAANVGIDRSVTPYVALLNADTEAYPDFVSSLLARIERSAPVT